MSLPSPLPRYIYKILPSAISDVRYSFPIPIPASHEFYLSPLDQQDGFLHFSTSEQVLKTLNSFFTDEVSVVLLKCDYGRLSSFKNVKWDPAAGTLFPHVYAKLIGEDVESFKEIVSGGDWSEALAKAQKEGWLVQ